MQHTQLKELFAAPLAHSQEAELIDSLLLVIVGGWQIVKHNAACKGPSQVALEELSNYLALELPRLASDCSLEAEDLAPAYPTTNL